jgi:hypothetical protein
MRLLTLCLPTVDREGRMHITGDRLNIVLAPDEFHRFLLQAEWEIDVASLAKAGDRPLLCSRLPLRSLAEVRMDQYDVLWHMFRDPTQPEVLQILSELKTCGQPVINDAFRLADHHKRNYLPIFRRLGIGPGVSDDVRPDSNWLRYGSVRISPDRHWIETFAVNNNRGRSSTHGHERIITEYLDNQVHGKHSIVRFGVAFGQGFRGFRYWSDRPSFKTGDATFWEPYAVPEPHRPAIRQALEELGCDVCHVEAVPVGERLYVFDVNPYPTADGRTLSQITESLATIIARDFQRRMGRVNHVAMGGQKRV